MIERITIKVKALLFCSYTLYFLVEADVEAMEELADELPSFDETVKRIQRDTDSEEASMQ